MSLNVVVFPQKTQHGIEFRVFCRLSKNRRLQDGGEFLSKQTFATDEVWRQTYNTDVFECRRFFMPAANKMAAIITVSPRADLKVINS
jgi:hypothetical protein